MTSGIIKKRALGAKLVNLEDDCDFRLDKKIHEANGDKKNVRR